MESTERKRSSSRRDLGLQEAPREDKASNKRRKSKKPPSEEEKKKLYVLVWHGEGSDYANSLYALDIPTTVSHPEPPQRSPVEPVLRFSSREWPRIMTCISLNSKLYFIGGEKGNRLRNKPLSYTRKVYVMDVSSEEEIIPSSKRDFPREVLKQCPSMNTGKCSPVVSFVADGKIFVVSGIKHEDLAQFEVFDPVKCKWKKLKYPPPFTDASSLSRPLIVDRNVLFFGDNHKWDTFTYWYNLDSGTWSERRPPYIGFRTKDYELSFRNQPVGETHCKICAHQMTRVHVAVRLDISNKKKNKDKEKKKKKKKDFKVVEYGIEYSVAECGASTDSIVTRLGGVGDAPGLSVSLCYLEVVFSPDEDNDHEKCHLNVMLFDVHDNGDRAEYLTSAYYVAHVDGIPDNLVAANAV